MTSIGVALKDLGKKTIEQSHIYYDEFTEIRKTTKICYWHVNERK
jgi:hypothetical protein